MRIDKKVSRYVNKNGNIVDCYDNMCKILCEKSTSGEGKINQLQRWRLYFDFENSGHKFIIKEIYDDKTVKENEMGYKSNNETKLGFERSKYRKTLMPIILYLIDKSGNNFIMETSISLAVKCGFFDSKFIRFSKYKDYISYRTKIKKKFLDKNYFKIDIEKASFDKLINRFKDNTNGSIERALKKLQELGLVAYCKCKFGINPGERKLLTPAEIEKYNECEQKAINVVCKLYNLKKKKNKPIIQLNDFIYDYKIANKYYNILKELTRKELGYSDVIPFYFIYGKPSELSEKISTVKTYEEYQKAKMKINRKFVTSMKKRSDSKIIKEEEKKMQFDKLENEGNQESSYDENHIAHHNRIELLDFIVSIDESTDVVDIKEYEKKERNNM